MKIDLDTKKGQYRAGYLCGRLFWSKSEYRRRCGVSIANSAIIHQLYSNETPPEGFLIASNPVDMTAVFTAYQAYLTIYINGITRKNYAQSFNSIASYDYSAAIGNNVTSGTLTGIKQRQLDINTYLNPGVFNVCDDKNINNFQRESSI
jgi:hypothetical protein